ncbi:MAG: right-handed parallel beta-helix repeat-containing protein, partial [Thermodesulfobacteriota bacterium]
MIQNYWFYLRFISTFFITLFITQSLLFAAPVETVTNRNDTGAGSLRQAIAEVDTNGKIVFDIAGPGPNTIVVSTPLEIDKSMTISGPGQNLLTVMTGGGIDQVIIVSDNNPAQSPVAISDLTVHGDMDTFSGILNRENLTLNHLTVTGSSDGITNSGQNSVGAVLRINNSNLTRNFQSGIFVFGGLEPGAAGGHVTINDSLISDNSDFGILNFTPQHEFAQGSKVVVTNTTISANKFGIINNTGSGARGNIGSITEVYNSTITKNFGQMGIANGNAIFNTGGTAEDAAGGKVIVHNSTLSDNDGPAITISPGSTASITQISSTTVSGNVFALLYLPGGPSIPVVEVKNSIFANSKKAPDALFPSNCAPDTVTLTSLGVNISTDGTCAGFVEVTPD